MDFKAATDVLFERVSHEDLAAKLRVSVASLRQARLRESAQSHRSPPRGWENALAELAKAKIEQLVELLSAIEDCRALNSASVDGRPSRAVSIADL